MNQTQLWFDSETTGRENIRFVKPSRVSEATACRDRFDPSDISSFALLQINEQALAGSDWLAARNPCLSFLYVLH